MFNGLLRIFARRWRRGRAAAIASAMSDSSPRHPGGLAGGVLVALFMIAGTLVGTLYRQPSIGFLAGLATGAALALLVWWLDRRRA